MRSTIYDRLLQICAATKCVRNAGFQGYLSINVAIAHWECTQAHAGDVFVYVRISESTFRIVSHWQTHKNLLCLLH